MRWETEYYLYLNWKDRWQVKRRAFSGQLNSFKSPVKNMTLSRKCYREMSCNNPKTISILFHTIVVLTE